MSAQNKKTRKYSPAIAALPILIGLGLLLFSCPPPSTIDRTETADEGKPATLDYKQWTAGAYFDQAHARVYEQDVSGAIDLLEKFIVERPNDSLASEAVYLVAYFSENAGDLPTAEIKYRQYYETGGPLSEPAIEGRARVLELLDDHTGAAQLLGSLLAESPDYPEVLTVRRKMAELLFAADVTDLACSQVDLLYGENRKAAENMWWAAECLRYRGAEAEAARIYRQLWRDRPLDRRADEAYDRLKILGRDGVDNSDRLARAEAFINAYQLKRALGLFYKIERELKSKPDDADYKEAIYGKGRIYFKLRNYRRAEESFRKFMALDLSDADRARGLYMLGRSKARRDKLSDAKKTYMELAETYPRSNLADDAFYNSALIEKYTDNPLEAAQMMAELPGRYPDGDMRPAAIWAAGWLYYLSGDYLRALMHFIDAENAYENVRHQEKAVYWQARALEKENRREEAAGVYMRVITKFPLSYHSNWALYRLDRLGYDTRGLDSLRLENYPFPDPTSEFTGRARLEVEKAQTLQLLGLTEQADRVWSGFSARWIPGPSAAAFIAEKLHEAGAYNAGQMIAWTTLELYFLNDDYSVAYENVWRLGYPKAFAADAYRFSGKVEPHLLWAVMREESRYNPQVVSWAGAYGLMQFIVPTAKAVWHNLGKGKLNRGMLFDPTVNIELGATYLDNLIDDFSGNVYYALGGYNGGPHNISRWLKEKPELEMDEFIEDIPYDETRYYIKKVARSYIRYRYLYPEEGQTRLVRAPIVYQR